MRDSLKVKQIDIEESDYAFYFRFRLSGQTVDIFSHDHITFQGIIINSVKEYSRVKFEGDYRTRATKLHSEQVPIDSSLAASVARKIIDSGQPSIPTDSLIGSWNRWYFHCGSLKFEMKYDQKFIKQSYHCPWSQPDTAEFKEVILANYNLLKQDLKLDSIHHTFWTTLPKGKTYSTNGYGMTYLLTDKQEIAWIKDQPRKDYLRSIKDTVDNYLTTELQKRKINPEQMSCRENYQLTFNVNGKLQKLQLPRHEKPNILDGLGWYIEDKIEIRRCKRFIRRIFREVNLSAFNLQHKVYRTLSYGSEGEMRLGDNTIY
jgi:hypothetical protein